jgi:glycosyltransferase involved in cell wall biosynthesis
LSAISVIVPCYNYGRYLSEAIESVLAQTRQPNEILVINDGSTDDTSVVAKRFHVTLIEQDNQGVVHARNRGIDEAKGEYIFFLDADDIIEPTCLETAERALDDAPKDVGYIYSQMLLFGATTGLLNVRPYSLRSLLSNKSYIGVDSLYRRSVLLEVGGFSDAMAEVYEDWDMHLSIAEKGYRGLFVPEPLVHYRQHHEGSRNEAGPILGKRERERVCGRHPTLFTPRVLRRLRIEWYIREEVIGRAKIAFGYIRRGEYRTFVRRVLRK